MENKWFLKGGRGSGKTIRALYEVYGNRITELEKENRLLGERCNQLLKDKGNLTDELQELKETLAQTVENDEVAYETLKLHDQEEIGMLNSKVAELENKIADIKANCDLAIEGRDIKIKELELELTVEKDQHQEEINLHLHAEDYIKELEKDIEYLKACKQKIIDLQKENEELKAEIENDRDLPTVAYMQGAENQKKKDEIQLTKAKGHIKQLLDCLKQDTNDPQTNYYVCQYMDKAEQFLKEIEK